MMVVHLDKGLLKEGAEGVVGEKSQQEKLSYENMKPSTVLRKEEMVMATRDKQP
jgi:hypothetical protein